MKITSNNKPWKYLFLLGPFLLTAGLSAGVVGDNWNGLPLVFILLGLAIIVAWFVLYSRETKWWSRRSTKISTQAMLTTLAVLAILALVNFLATRYQLRTDLTETKLFSLAPQSQAVVRSLPQPVKVWVFDAIPNPIDRELLENYRRVNAKFQFEFVNPQDRPGLAKKFDVKDYGEVYLESQGKPQLLQVVNQNDRLTEAKITNRLQQIASNRTAKVYFVQGHGEHPLTQAEGGMSLASTALREKNFTVEPLNLASKSSLPEDADVVVVAGPKRSLLDAEVQALRAYLNRGGNLLLAIDHGTEPKLDSLLQEWGVKLDNRLAVVASGDVALGPAVPIVTDYGKHPITKDFGNGISLYRYARPIIISQVAGVQSTPLIETKPYPDSWAESDLQNENLKYDQDKDLKGPLTLGVALTRKVTNQPSTPAVIPSPTLKPQGQVSPTPGTSAKPQNTVKPTPTPSPKASPNKQSNANPFFGAAVAAEVAQATPTPAPTASPIAPPTRETNQTSKEARLVVLGNSEFATDAFFGQQLNGDVFLNSVTWVSQQDAQPLSIRPKQSTNRRINLSPAQASLISLSSVILLPLIGLVASGFIWWQRR